MRAACVASRRRETGFHPRIKFRGKPFRDHDPNAGRFDH
jgi:hypothetical protein